MNKIDATAKKLHESGIKHFRNEALEPALEKLQEAIQHAPEGSRQQAEIYNDLGVVYRDLEDFDAAHHALDEALTRFEALQDIKGQAQTFGNWGAVFEAEELAEQAVEAYKKSATMLEEIGESEMAMYVWQAISRLRARQGQYIAAIGAYEEGVENMPKGSIKRKILEKILRAPGKLLGNAGSSTAESDENE